MSARPLRTVLVGLGNIGAKYAEDPRTARYFPYATHAQVLATHPGFSWVGAIDRSEQAVDHFRRHWKVPLCTQRLDEMARSHPEVAVLATPPDDRISILHAFDTLRAVIVEKPLGTTFAESRRFLHACRSRGIAVQVNLWRRADRFSRELAGPRLNNLIGSPQFAFGVYGNGLRNNGIHMVDLARMLLGEVASVQAVSSKKLAKAGTGDDWAVSFHLRFSCGLIGMFQPLDFNHYRENGLDIWGSHGRLALLQEGLTVMHYPKQAHRALTGPSEVASDEGKSLDGTAGDALYRLYDNLAAHLISTEEPLYSDADNARQTESVIEAIERSCNSGHAMVSPYQESPIAAA